MKWSEFFEKEMNSIGEDLIVEAMECNKVTVELKAYYVESRPNIFKNIMTAAACILLAVAMTVSFVLMRRSITPGGQPTTDTETETNEPETTDREPEPDTDTTASEDTEMPVEELPVPEDGEQLVFLCVEKNYKSRYGNINFYYTYDEFGKLIEVKEKSAEEIFSYYFYYNEKGELNSVVAKWSEGMEEKKYSDGKMIEYKWTDAKGSVRKLEEYKYNSAGNCTYKLSTSYSENLTEHKELYEYDYDERNRLIETRFFTGESKILNYRWEYFYNDKDRLILAQKTEETLNPMFPHYKCFVYIEYEYDDNGNMIYSKEYSRKEDYFDGEYSETISIGSEVFCLYDDHNRLIERKKYYEEKLYSEWNGEYNENGNLISEIQLSRGTMSSADDITQREYRYDWTVNVEGKISTFETSVYVDGSYVGVDVRTVLYDTNGNIITEISQDAGGDTITLSYVYTAVCLTENEIELIGKACPVWAETFSVTESHVGYMLYESIFSTIVPDNNLIELP